MNKLVSNKLFIFMLSIVIFIGSGYALTTVYDLKVVYFILFFSIVLAIPTLQILFGKRVSARSLIGITLALGIIITMINNMNNGNGYFGYLIYLIFAFEISVVYGFPKIRKMFIQAMTVISIISIIGYIGINILNISFNFVTNINGTIYGNGLVYFYAKGREIRNFGPFWEPGLFATFLILALVFIIMDKSKKLDLTRFILFSITLLTTTSSAGYFLYALCLVLLISKNKGLSRNIIRYGIYISYFLIMVFLIQQLAFENVELFQGNEFLSKLQIDSIFGSSRFESIAINWEIFTNSPLFGAGINNYTELIKGYNSADVNTSLSFLAIFGILGFSYTMLLVSGVIGIKDESKFTKMVLLVIALTILNKEPHNSILMTWILLVSSYEVLKYDEKLFLESKSHP